MISSILLTTLNILGSLGIFLYGMKVMSEGIQKVAGNRLRNILAYMTQNRFAGILTGFITTCLVQSSSATTVMVISFVNAGLLTLVQSISVVMGANIGTTITIWMVAFFGFNFDINTIALPAIGIGLPLIFSKISKRKNIGEIFVGFGLLFLGIKYLKNSVPNIKNNPEVLQFLTSYTDLGILSLFIFIFVGIILTLIVQSSSAAMVITLAMAYNGWIDFKTAAALVLGQNIGTTITAYIASLGANYHAKRTARAHMLFNVFGVVWMILLFNLFIGFLDYFMPIEPSNQLDVGFKYKLAMFHTLFNVLNVLALVWFIPQIANIVKKMVKPSKDEKQMEYKLEYFSTSVQPIPEISILEAKKEVLYMSETINKLTYLFHDTFQNNKLITTSINEARTLETLTDQMQEQISNYLAECTKHELSVNSAKSASNMIRIINEQESIGDSLLNLFFILENLEKDTFTEEMKDQILDLYNHVNEFILWNYSFISENLKSMNEDDLQKSITHENKIDNLRNKLIDLSSQRLSKDSNTKSELLFIDMTKHLEHIGDFCLNISQALEQ